MTNTRDFTDIERAAMEAVEYFARRNGGAQWLVDQFGLGKRTAHRLVGKQQPPPVGIADDIAKQGITEWSNDQTARTIDPAPGHIKALLSFVEQRRTPKGGSDGQA